MRQVEFTETVRISTVEYVAGDRKSFPDSEAAEYIRVGWAKDSATGEQGKRKPGAQAINVDNVRNVIG